MLVINDGGKDGDQYWGSMMVAKMVINDDGGNDDGQ